MPAESSSRSLRPRGRRGPARRRAGWATHALLDACTSYGTQLLWPFSDLRVAWNVVSIVDPVFTLPLILGVGAVQHARAASAQEALADARGHAGRWPIHDVPAASSP